MSYRAKPSANPEENCSVPDCETSGGPPTTCVTWGKRFCYPHFADWASWAAANGASGRAATDAEWARFLKAVAEAE